MSVMRATRDEQPPAFESRQPAPRPPGGLPRPRAVERVAPAKRASTAGTRGPAPGGVVRRAKARRGCSRSPKRPEHGGIFRPRLPARTDRSQSPGSWSRGEGARGRSARNERPERARGSERGEGARESERREASAGRERRERSAAETKKGGPRGPPLSLTKRRDQEQPLVDPQFGHL